MLLGSGNAVVGNVYMDAAVRHARQTGHAAKNLAQPPVQVRLFSQLPKQDSRSRKDGCLSGPKQHAIHISQAGRMGAVNLSFSLYPSVPSDMWDCTEFAVLLS